ncbi:LysR family transcriptional regulator [Kutzneria buriramensis]|uniref:DNA-binding transcriptional LysR family regulator n=1 Tax=Kutzneria buriramensis TaxID=1045776 RepID=A0A3E0I5B9_9PSEU|nr:LysR substrate-binding domain-containing protein [Kutzneria buriramensis]REH53948.1 DNA-binding transcriptional LysR family regulator [Kutzneria buriramensis]
MELRQLEYFVAVAEDANFTRAAERLHVAQPGVSAQIKQLERELGLPLLDRSGRTVTLTEAGAAVLPFARAALGAVAGSRQVVDELSGLVRGRVAIGTITSCPAVAIADMIAGFHHEHPAIEITLSQDNSDRLVDAVRAGGLDLAVIALSASTNYPGVALKTFVDEPIVAAVGDGDPFQGKKTLPIGAFRDRDLISMPPGTGVRSCLDEACALAGFAPRIAFEANDPTMLMQLARRGLGVAFLPTSMAARPGLHPIAVASPALRGQLALAWRADGPISPAATALIDHGIAALASPSS